MGKYASELISFEEVVRSVIHGEHFGLLAGPGGMEFDHLREWMPGDPPADIDSMASYIRNKPIVKVRLPERELEVVFLVDNSASMFFGSVDRSKIERTGTLIKRAIEVAGGDHLFCSLALFSEGAIKIVPLGSGMAALGGFQTNRVLLEERGDNFPVRQALREMSLHGEEKTLIVLVLSDFLNVPDTYRPELRALILAGHKVCGVAVVDPLEAAMPRMPFACMHICDAETGDTAFMRRAKDFLAPHRGLFKDEHGAFVALNELTNQHDEEV